MPAQEPDSVSYQGMKTEIGAGMVLFPKTTEDLAWNNASERAIAIVQNYEQGFGLFQMTRKKPAEAPAMKRLSSTVNRDSPVSRMSQKSENTSMSNYDTWLISDPYEDYAHALRRRADDADPFYTVAEPCEDCGRPVDDCQCSIPDEPLCEVLVREMRGAKTVPELLRLTRQHLQQCELCNPKVIRMQPNEQTAPEPHRKAA